MILRFAALSLLIVLGFASSAPLASAYYGSGRDSRSSFDTSGRIRYDNQGIAYWDYGSGSRSSRDRYDYRDDRDNQDGYYDRKYRGRSGSSCFSVEGRIRYDSRGIAYWDAGSASRDCR